MVLAVFFVCKERQTVSSVYKEVKTALLTNQIFQPRLAIMPLPNSQLAMPCDNVIVDEGRRDHHKRQTGMCSGWRIINDTQRYLWEWKMVIRKLSTKENELRQRVRSSHKRCCYYEKKTP